MICLLPTLSFATPPPVTEGEFNAAGLARVGDKVVISSPTLRIGNDSYHLAIDVSATDDQIARNAICKIYKAGNFAVDYTSESAGDDRQWNSVALLDGKGNFVKIDSSGYYFDTLTCTNQSR